MTDEPVGEPSLALMDAAFRVFAQRGYRSTPLDDVAEAVGLTKGAIYYYFDGKEDLLRRAVQSRHRTFFGALAATLEDEREPVTARLRLVLRQLWQHWMEPGWGLAVRLMMGEVSQEFPAVFREWAQEGLLRATALVRELVEVGRRRGEFRPDVDAEVAARLVTSGLMLQAALHVHLRLSDLSPCEPDRIFDSAVDLFLHGLAVLRQPPAALPGPRI